ncbi:Rne/Rng family ribonuclease [Bacillus benzoevorans]|uniref:Ribonuclease G n=1 Tax=Bacillus benzoevorans TaxID=1456 RepID=A0A7X0HUN6_9BACI|nr:ribonuclease E/G [Bacillus benzoevorans]MBB6445881.1 ribonuclease G [Bacillus benzoevorans]
MKKLIINSLTREKRYALLDEQKLERLFVNQPKHVSLVGNIYYGVVTKVLPGMNAAFVEIGEGKNGFIHRDKLVSFVLANVEKAVKDSRSISSFVHQGEKLLVQVEKDATGTKGPRLTGVIELSGEHVIYMPKGRYVAVSKKILQPEVREKWRHYGYDMKSPEEGLLFRTSSDRASEEELYREVEELRAEYQHLEHQVSLLKKPAKVLERDPFLTQLSEEIKAVHKQVEVITDERKLMEKLQHKFPELPLRLYTGRENIFSAYQLEGEIEKSLKRIVWLDKGAYLVIDEEEALTVIDVNTGKFSGKQDLADTVLKTNLLAAEEAARQIRLRDLAGMILIDFIDMKTEQERMQILKKMAAELKSDPRRTNLLGFTELGILQITRKKTKVSISESMLDRCPVCDGTGRIPSAETIAFRLERELYEYRHGDVTEAVIETTEEVVKVFCGEQNIHKKRLEEILGFSLQFQSNNHVKPYYEILQLRLNQ